MTSPSRLFMHAGPEYKLTRVDEKTFDLYKIIATSYKQVDQDSWTLDQEISWAALNEYLGLNVVPGELIPYETCMKIVGGFTALGLDWDDIPKEGLDLMGLLSSIHMHIVPITRNLTMKNEYSFTTFESLHNNDQKHYMSGAEIKGVHLNLGNFDGVTPNRNGHIYPKGSMDLSNGNHDPEVPRKILVTDLENVDLKDLWAGNTTVSIRGKIINKEDLMNMITDVNVEDAYPKIKPSGKTDWALYQLATGLKRRQDDSPTDANFDLGEAVESQLAMRKQYKHGKGFTAMTDAERHAFNHLQYQLSGSMGSGEHCLVGEVSDYAHIPDAFPDMVYSEEQLRLYTERPWLTPEEATSVGIIVRLDGKPLHPRHWRYAAGNGLIVFLDSSIDSDRAETVINTSSEFAAMRFLPKWMRESEYGAFDKSIKTYKLPEEYLNVLQADIDAGKIKVCIVGPRSIVRSSWRDAIKKHLENNPDVILVDSLPEDIFKNGINRGIAIDTLGTYQMLGRTNYAAFAKQAQGYFEQEPVPNEPTVKGNSRQAIIDNGTRTWPAPRSKKGHRRHGK